MRNRVVFSSCTRIFSGYEWPEKTLWFSFNMQGHRAEKVLGFFVFLINSMFCVRRTHNTKPFVLALWRFLVFRSSRCCEKLLIIKKILFVHWSTIRLCRTQPQQLHMSRRNIICEKTQAMLFKFNQTNPNNGAVL